MDLAVSDLCAVGDVSRGVLERGGPVDAGPEVGADLELGADARAEEGLILFGRACQQGVPVVPYRATDVDEGTQDQVPVRSSVDLLRCRPEIPEQRDPHRLANDRQRARDVETILEGPDRDRVADRDGLAVASNAVEAA